MNDAGMGGEGKGTYAQMYCAKAHRSRSLSGALEGFWLIRSVSFQLCSVINSTMASKVWILTCIKEREEEGKGRKMCEQTPQRLERCLRVMRGVLAMNRRDLLLVGKVGLRQVDPDAEGGFLRDENSDDWRGVIRERVVRQTDRDIDPRNRDVRLTHAEIVI